MINIGKFVNTHGIKGEIRLLSKYDYEAELQTGKTVVIKDREFKIRSTRKHKNFTLIFFEGINSINDIEHLKGNDIFAEKASEEISMPEYIGYEVYEGEEFIGEVIDFIMQGSTYSLVVRKENGGTNYLPMVEQFIEEINEEVIYIKGIEL